MKVVCIFFVAFFSWAIAFVSQRVTFLLPRSIHRNFLALRRVIIGGMTRPTPLKDNCLYPLQVFTNLSTQPPLNLLINTCFYYQHLINIGKEKHSSSLIHCLSFLSPFKSCTICTIFYNHMKFPPDNFVHLKTRWRVAHAGTKSYSHTSVPRCFDGALTCWHSQSLEHPAKQGSPPPLWNHHLGCVFLFLEQGLKQLKSVRPLLEPVYLVYLHRNQPLGRGSFPT